MREDEGLEASSSDRQDTASGWSEDLADLALRGWRAGRQWCTGCGGYHQLWGVLRAAGVVRGVEQDAAVLGPLLRRTVAPRSRVLLAGAADTGVFALLMRSVAPLRPRCAVVDRCRAPLQVIGDYAAARGVACERVQQDLLRWTPAEPYDLVLAHYTLSFVAGDELVAAVAAIARCTAAGGHALVALKAGRPASEAQAAAFRDAWLSEARASIEASGLADRVERAELDALLAAHAQARTRRKTMLLPVADVRACFERAGMRVVDEVAAGRRRRLRVGGVEDVEGSTALLLRAAP